LEYRESLEKNDREKETQGFGFCFISAWIGHDRPTKNALGEGRQSVPETRGAAPDRP
jgi:hypothetical protein